MLSEASDRISKRSGADLDGDKLKWEKPTLAPLKTIPVQYSLYGQAERVKKGEGQGGLPASRKYFPAQLLQRKKSAGSKKRP